jgi:hypothetical protein
VTILLSLLTELLHIGLMLAAAPTAAGVAQWLDGRLAGRTGPSILLPWRDLVRLSRKTPMLSESTSVVSRIAPTAALAATLTAAALVPSFTLGMALSPLADLLVIAALLSAARAAIALAALDSGAALAGLAQQGAGARAVVAEPAMMLVVVALALMGGSFNLDLIIGQQRDGVLLPAAASALALTALVALLLADVSDPNPGDQIVSGMDLAMLRTTGWLRRLIWIDLIGGLFLPVGIAGTDSLPLAWLIGLAAWAFKLAAVVLFLSAARFLIGPIPRQGLPDLIGVAALLALLATIMVLAGSAPA